MSRFPFVVLTSALVLACGTWVGSPKKRPGNGTTQENPPTPPPDEIPGGPIAGGGTTIDDGRAFLIEGAAPGLALVDAGATDVVAISADGKSVRWSEVSAGAKKFKLAIDRDRAWSVMLVDRTKAGLAMVLGTFAADTLDAVAPLAAAGPGVDLKDVTLEGAVLKGALDRADYLAAIGLTAEGAAYFGAIDDSSRRYANPDIDADGVIDATAPTNYHFSLNFHVGFDLRVGASAHAVIDDMVDKFLPASTVVANSSTWADVSLDRAYFPSAPTEFTYRFSEDTDASSYKGGNELITDHVAAGAAYTLPVVPGVSAETISFDVGFMPPVKPPNGTYSVEVAGKTLTFPNVVVPNFPVDQIYLLPFIRFNATDARTISTIDWEWRKPTTEGGVTTWVLATAEDIELTVGTDGGMLTLHACDDDGNRLLDKGVEFRIPRTPTGTLTWDDPTINFRGLSKEEGLALDLDHYAGPALLYTDKLGLFIGANIGAN